MPLHSLTTCTKTGNSLCRLYYILPTGLPYQLIGKYVVGHDADVGEDWVLVACAGLHIRACQWLLALSINQKRIATSVLQAAFL